MDLQKNYQSLLEDTEKFTDTLGSEVFYPIIKYIRKLEWENSEQYYKYRAYIQSNLVDIRLPDSPLPSSKSGTYLSAKFELSSLRGNLLSCQIVGKGGSYYLQIGDIWLEPGHDPLSSIEFWTRSFYREVLGQIYPEDVKESSALEDRIKELEAEVASLRAEKKLPLLQQAMSLVEEVMGDLTSPISEDLDIIEEKVHDLMETLSQGYADLENNLVDKKTIETWKKEVNDNIIQPMKDFLRGLGG